MSQKLILVFLAMMFSFCKSPVTMIEISSLEDIKKHNGKEVKIVGRYEEAILSKAPAVGEHKGYYKIVVNNKVEVLLLQPYNAESKRPEDEVSRFQGKMVEAIGIISDKTFMERPSLENLPLSVSMPCLTEIKSLKAL